MSTANAGHAATELAQTQAATALTCAPRAQHASQETPMFDTAIASSLPQPAWLAETRKPWPQWNLPGDDLARAMLDLTPLCLHALGLAKGRACTTAVHICYSHGTQASIQWTKTLGPEGRPCERSSAALGPAAALARQRLAAGAA